MQVGDRVTVQPQGFKGWIIGFTGSGRVNIRLRVPTSIHHNGRGKGQSKRISVLAKDVYQEA